MHRKLNLPDLFLAISLAMIALEAALAGLALINAKYRAMNTLASPATQAGNFLMNLGMAGVLMVRDRLFGTFAGERDEQPAHYGIVKNIGTFNPLRIAFHEWAAMLRDLWSTRSWREALGVVFGPPGWRPGGGVPTAKNNRSEWNARRLAG